MSSPPPFTTQFFDNDVPQLIRLPYPTCSLDQASPTRSFHTLPPPLSLLTSSPYSCPPPLSCRPQSQTSTPPYVPVHLLQASGNYVHVQQERSASDQPSISDDSCSCSRWSSPRQISSSFPGRGGPAFEPRSQRLAAASALHGVHSDPAVAAPPSSLPHDHVNMTPTSLPTFMSSPPSVVSGAPSPFTPLFESPLRGSSPNNLPPLPSFPKPLPSVSETQPPSSSTYPSSPCTPICGNSPVLLPRRPPPPPPALCPPDHPYSQPHRATERVQRPHSSFHMGSSVTPADPQHMLAFPTAVLLSTCTRTTTPHDGGTAASDSAGLSASLAAAKMEIARCRQLIEELQTLHFVRPDDLTLLGICHPDGSRPARTPPSVGRPSQRPPSTALAMGVPSPFVVVEAALQAPAGKAQRPLPRGSFLFSSAPFSAGLSPHPPVPMPSLRSGPSVNPPGASPSNSASPNAALATAPRFVLHCFLPSKPGIRTATAVAAASSAPACKDAHAQVPGDVSSVCHPRCSPTAGAPPTAQSAAADPVAEMVATRPPASFRLTTLAACIRAYQAERAGLMQWLGAHGPFCRGLMLPRALLYMALPGDAWLRDEAAAVGGVECFDERLHEAVASGLPLCCFVCEAPPTTLAQFAASQARAVGHIPAATIGQLLRGLLRAVSALHARAIYHRNIGFGSVWVGADGEARLGSFEYALVLGRWRRADAASAPASPSTGGVVGWAPCHSNGRGRPGSGDDEATSTVERAGSRSIDGEEEREEEEEYEEEECSGDVGVEDAETRRPMWQRLPSFGCPLWGLSESGWLGDQSLPPPEIVRAFSHFLENYPTQPSPPPPPPPLPDISPRASSSRIRLPALSRASAPERPGSSDPHSSSPFTVSLDARTFARADVFSLGLLALALMQVTGSHLENLFPPLTPGAPDLRRGDLQQVPEAPRPWWLFPPPAEGATRRFSGSFVAQMRRNALDLHAFFAPGSHASAAPPVSAYPASLRSLVGRMLGSPEQRPSCRRCLEEVEKMFSFPRSDTET